VLRVGTSSVGHSPGIICRQSDAHVGSHEHYDGALAATSALHVDVEAKWRSISNPWTHAFPRWTRLVTDFETFDLVPPEVRVPLSIYAKIFWRNP
jgi:hypothetical protein